MGYRIENKPIVLTGKKALTKISSDKSGDVYRYRNQAVRIFKDNDDKHIDQETARLLSSIPTENILLPRKLVFFNSAFKGYSMKLVPKKGITRRMISAPKEEFLGTVSALETDSDTLSKRHILLSEITPANAFYNGEIYLCNPDKYSLLELQSTDDLSTINRFQIHLLIIEMIAMEMKKAHYTQPIINRVKEMLALKDPEQDICDFYDDIIDGKTTIKQMIKKII